jgi:hypothetical protein
MFISAQLAPANMNRYPIVFRLLEIRSPPKDKIINTRPMIIVFFLPIFVARNPAGTAKTTSSREK